MCLGMAIGCAQTNEILRIYAAAAAKSLQLCPTLCDPIDGSPPGSPVPGILQARTLECVAISFSNEGKWKVKVKSFSHIWLLVTPWTAAYQAPLSTGFSRQEYWSGCHCLLRTRATVGKTESSRKLPYSPGSSAWCSVMTQRAGMGVGGRWYMRTCSWYTLLCSRNQHNIVKQLYSNKNKI